MTVVASDVDVATLISGHVQRQLRRVKIDEFQYQQKSHRWSPCRGDIASIMLFLYIFVYASVLAVFISAQLLWFWMSETTEVVLYQR